MKRYTYYTPIDLARSILTIIPEASIESIVDICCGSWNLLQAGKEKFQSAEITGVDVDCESEKHRFPKSNFQVADGRNFAKEEYKKGKTYDLILSNPPFGYISEDERKYSAENEIAKVCYSELLNKRYECEMIQANLLLAHDNSILLFILPYTFVAGTSFQKARCQVAKDYAVMAIVELPCTTFEKGKINTFAVILQKKQQREKTTVYNAANDGGWKIDRLREIDEKEIKDGNWWFVSNNTENKKIKIFRGNVSSGKFISEGQAILHCAAKKSEQWIPSVRYYDASTEKKTVIARRGDVLINRIGRDAGYWNVNEIDEISVSDCLLVLPNITKKMLQTLKSNSDDNGRLKIPVRGVSTSYVTAEDVILLFDGNGEISVG